MLKYAAMAALVWGNAPACAAAPAAIQASDFPVVSKRCDFFEERINSPDLEIRKRALLEIDNFDKQPTPEYVRFLKRMMKDHDPVMSGQALSKLYDLWVVIVPEELPDQFIFLDNRVIDRRDERMLPRLREECRGNRQSPGYAAYLLGMLQDKEAIPELRNLAEDSNIYVRYTAARSLHACGDGKSARAILDTIIESQLALYQANAANPSRELGKREPYYAVSACRAFMELGKDEHRSGLQRLILLWELMEKSIDRNDDTHRLRQVFASVSGKFVATSAEAQTWFKEEYGKGKQ